MNSQKRSYGAFCWLISIMIAQTALGADTEVYTHKLSQSNTNYIFWTAPPAERVFKNNAVPTETASAIKVYAAKNEFEPFQVIVQPAASGNVTVNIGSFGPGIESEIYQVKYVDIVQATDSLGKTGPYPDPLWPMENGGSATLTAGENTSFWFSVSVSETVSAGDYSANVQIGGVNIPVQLHVFDFAIPNDLHVKSQMNFSYNTVLSKYGVSGTGDAYWMYVDMMKQFFIDHRLTPKSVNWPGGVASNGAGPFIDYDCAGTITDGDGIWGFEQPAARYLDGAGLLSGQFTESFNGGGGFPSFMAATFLNNDASADQRRSPMCSLARTSADWYLTNNPSSPYNQMWLQWMTALRNYLNNLGYLDKAYYYFANEPQDQADYDAVAWYSKMVKSAASDLKLMVSEEPKEAIYNHSDYVYDHQIDIWLPVLNNYDPTVSHDREKNHGEETWIYFLHGTRPPYFNPITLDHPGVESKFTGWFLWKYRIKGIAYYSLNDWSKNPWTDPMTSDHNGDTFMLYPPSMDNSSITYGGNNHRLVPSIRFELMRDSLEDYEYLYVLNGSAQPQVDAVNDADAQADKIISGLTSYTRNSEFMYNLRRLIGLKNGNEISTIPDIQPPPLHPRSEDAPGDYYINFQDPYEKFSSNPYGNPQMRDEIIAGESYRILDYNGKSYYAVGADAYDEGKGFGWFGNIISHPVEGRDQWGVETDETKRTYVGDNYGKVNTFDFALPNGNYSVTLCVGRPRSDDAHNKAVIEGVIFVNDEATTDAAQFIIRTKQVSVSDNALTVEIGLSSMDEYTMLDYLLIEALGPTANFTANRTTGEAPLAVQFMDSSTNNPDAWNWDFNNDGVTDSTEQHPEFIFTDTGAYDVSLTVSNAYGSHTLTKDDYIVVYGKGDFNCDGYVNLADCIGILQITAGMTADQGACPDLMGDLSGNDRLGIEDAIGALQVAAGLREL